MILKKKTDSERNISLILWPWNELSQAKENPFNHLRAKSAKRYFKIVQKKPAKFAYVNHLKTGQWKGIQDFRERLTVGSWPAREGNAQYGSCLKIRHRLHTHTHTHIHTYTRSNNSKSCGSATNQASRTAYPDSSNINRPGLITPTCSRHERGAGGSWAPHGSAI